VLYPENVRIAKSSKCELKELLSGVLEGMIDFKFLQKIFLTVFLGQ